MKEDEKSHLKTTIENDSKVYDQQLSKIRNQLDEQKKLIADQRKHLNMLQSENQHC